MALLSAITAMAVLVGSGSAQQSMSEHIWAAAAYVLHGERTPFYAPNPPTLTPFGAQQLHSQGSVFRDRYLVRGVTDDEDHETGIERAPIVGIQRNAIDNSQMDIISTTDTYIFGSALSFMQGLYPPIVQAFGNSSGGMESATSANGSMENYPLDGYQYPNIKTSSVSDIDSIWTEGQTGCTQYIESMLDFRNDEDVVFMYNTTLDFYRSMWQQLFREDIPLAMSNYYNAYALYDYALYEFNHNTDNDSRISPDELETLAMFAASAQRSRNANLTASGLTRGDNIRAIAGRTMAAKVLSWFNMNIHTQGSQNKLGLAFTGIEPFVAFFSLAKLTSSPSRATFNTLPQPGAAMVFELFSIGGNSSVYPSMDDLWVRFLYRNSTDPGAHLIQYPLFGNGNSQSTMRFSEFIQGIQNIDVSGIAEWCRVCDSISLYCLGLSSNSGGEYGSGGSSGSHGRDPKVVTPVIAGVIGAVVTIAVVGVGMLLAVFFGCLRFHRNGSDSSQQRNSSLGGFRGAEKMASDVDVAYAGTGSRHERTGSWELRGGGGKKAGGSGSAVAAAEEPVSPLSTAGATFQPARLRSSLDNRADDDAISEMGHQPTRPREF